MAAPTTQRPTALPPQPGKPAHVKVPAGAVKMSRAYLDESGLPQKSIHPVPVDDAERRTAHVLHQCPHMKVINGGGKERCTEKEWLLPDDKARFCRDHGKQYEPNKAGPTEWELITRDAVRLHGRSAMPWLIPTGMCAADAALHVLNVGAVLPGLAVPAAAGLVYAGSKYTLTSRAIARRRLEKGEKVGRRYQRIKDQARRHAWYTGEAGLWAAALAGTDITHLPGVVVAGLGMLRWGFACQQWWRTADQRRVAAATVNVEVPVAPASAAPDPVQLQAVTTWATIIGCKGGPLADTDLVEFRRLPNCQVGADSRTLLPNWTAKVVAKLDGNINMRENRPSLRGRIAAAFKCTYADVSFYADESDLSVGWVRVQPDNPLAETRMWTGPTSTDWKAGTSRIGRFDDGEPMLYQWCDEGGACHDLIGGCSGSGKSEAVAQLILTSLHSSGLVLDWVGDPQRGQSFGELKDEVDWFARDKSEIKLMLLAAVKEMYRRNDVLANRNIKTWRISLARELDMPLLVITLDEVQNYIEDPEILEMVTILAGMARKVGIKLRLITQIIAAYNLGGDTYIKEQVKTGQTLVFRAETDVAGRSSVEGDSLIDPTELPRRWGAHTCAAGRKTQGLVFMQGIHGRDVYGRTDYTGEKMKVWLVGPAGDPTVSPGKFSPEAQQESGVLWSDRKERARRLIEAGRSDEDILSGGKALELIEAAAVSQATNAVVRAPAAGAAPLPDRARDTVLAVAYEVADDNGRVEKPAIVKGVKGRFATSTVDKALQDIVADGELIRVKNGHYLVPDRARARQLELDVADGS